MSHSSTSVFLTPKIGPYCMRSLTINHYSELSDRVDHRIMYHLCAGTVCVVSNCLNHLHHIQIHNIGIISLLFLIALLLFFSLLLSIFSWYFDTLVSTKAQLGFCMPLVLPSCCCCFLTITVGLWSRPQSTLARFV